MKPGRKPKPASQRKDAYLRVRLTEKHFAEVRAAADRRGISVSAWVVERILLAARGEAEGKG